MVTLLGADGNSRLQVMGIAPTLLRRRAWPSTRKPPLMKRIPWLVLRLLNLGARTFPLRLSLGQAHQLRKALSRSRRDWSQEDTVLLSFLA